MHNKTVVSKLRAIARKLMQSFDGGQHTNGRVADRRLLRSGYKGCQFGKCQTPCMCGRVSLSEPKLFLPGQNFQFNTNLNIYMIWSSHE